MTRAPLLDEQSVVALLVCGSLGKIQEVILAEKAENFISTLKFI